MSTGPPPYDQSTERPAPPVPPPEWHPPPYPPVEPEPSRYAFESVAPEASDLVGVGADLAPGTLLHAYRTGLFPMHVAEGRRRQLGWWSPDPRGVIPLDDLRVSRSLRRSCRRFAVTADRAFDQVIEACAAPGREGRWINDEIKDAYGQLHRMGWVHSIEVWSADGGLVGGLYGVAVGGLFAGESMFHRETDASKVALVELAHRLRRGGGRLLDTQWVTKHLASLGAREVPRTTYLSMVAIAVAAPQVTAFDDRPR